MKLLVTQFSPFSRHLIPLRSRYPPQLPVRNRSETILIVRASRDNCGISILERSEYEDSSQFVAATPLPNNLRDLK
jgi:hypothetical protein